MSRARRTLRGWRLPALLALAVVAAGLVIALLQPAPANGYLDPDGTGPTGSRALADLLAARGEQVVRVTAPPSGSAAPGSLELITGAGSLTAAQLAQAGRFDGDILLIASGDVAPAELHAPDDVPAALRAIAPAVHFAGYEAATVARPGCTAQAAVVSGDAYFYGALLSSAAPGSQSCYPAAHGGYSLVRYADGARTITVLGSSAPLSNAYLSSQGDAALSLNLLRSARQVIWVVPAPQAQADAAPGQRSFFSLVPWPAYLVAIQLGVATLLAAAWRARLLGPLVAERLPVIVRAAETVEGHGRLYQARRARDRAAGELRAAASARLAQMAGSATSEAIAARTGLPAAHVTALLHGPPPPTDQALVTLAAELDTLERKIRQS